MQVSGMESRREGPHFRSWGAPEEKQVSVGEEEFSFELLQG